MFRHHNLCGVNFRVKVSLKMTIAQVIYTSVTVNNSPILDYIHPYYHIPPS